MNITPLEFNDAHIIGTRVVVKHPAGMMPDVHTRTTKAAWAADSWSGKGWVEVADINIPIPLANVHLPELTTGSSEAAAGIATATRHADAVRPGWQDDAFTLLKNFISHHLHDGKFTAEQFRQWAYDRNMIEPPPKESAWGGVIKRAAGRGLIKKVGWGEATTPSAHGRPVAIWAKMPPSGF